MKSLTKKPGTFRAVCRQVARIPLSDVDPEVLATHLAMNGPTAWDRKRELEVALIPCTLDTTDRDLFARHMVDLHDGGAYRWDNASLEPEVSTVRRYSHRLLDDRGRVKPFRNGMGLRPEGKPFSPTRALAGSLQTCDACGLVADVGCLSWSQADELWWREHTEHCVGEPVSAQGAA